MSYNVDIGQATAQITYKTLRTFQFAPQEPRDPLCWDAGSTGSSSVSSEDRFRMRVL